MRAIAAVAIEENKNFRASIDRGGARGTGPPITPRRGYYSRSSILCAFEGIVGAAVVDHDHFVR